MIATDATMSPIDPEDLYHRLVSEMAVAFGRALRFARMRRGWDQATLAARAGINRGYISTIERGARNPTLDVIVRLAAAMGMAASDLVRAAEQESATSGETGRRLR